MGNPTQLEYPGMGMGRRRGGRGSPAFAAAGGAAHGTSGNKWRLLVSTALRAGGSVARVVAGPRRISR